MDFINYLFEQYGLKEIIVPGTEQYNIFKNTNTQKIFNNYINSVSAFVTARSSDLSHLHKHYKENKLQQDQT
jgi:hypothetical protein